MQLVSARPGMRHLTLQDLLNLDTFLLRPPPPSYHLLSLSLKAYYCGPLGVTTLTWLTGDSWASLKSLAGWRLEPRILSALTSLAPHLEEANLDVLRAFAERFDASVEVAAQPSVQRVRPIAFSGSEAMLARGSASRRSAADSAGGGGGGEDG